MLDQFQYAAAMHGDGPCLALAGPGSGKTTVLVHRIINLIRVHHVPPEQILVVTFTRDAARQMRERFIALYGEAAPLVTFGTFHGVCFSILKKESAFCDMHLMSPAEKKTVFRRLLRGMEIADLSFESGQESLEQAFGIYKRDPKNEDDQKRAGLLCGLDTGELIKKYDGYVKEKKKLRAMDFDDLIGLVHGQFKKDPNMLSRWRERFRYFLVDEMQDMDERQFELIRMLAAPLNNLFAVGDDDQSIYAFRGAAPSIMLNFKEYYPDAVIHRLERNYRSASLICDAAHRLIGHNSVRYEKELLPMCEERGLVRVMECMDEKEEAKYICRLLKDSSKPTAVIYRNRASCSELIRYMEHEGIGYHISGKSRMQDHYGIEEDLAAYLSAARGPVKRADMLRILNRPNRFLGRDMITDEIIEMDLLLSCFDEDSEEYGILAALFSQLKLIGSMRPYAAVNFIRKGIGYDGYLKEEAKKRHITENMILSEADRITAQMRGAGTVDEALLFLKKDLSDQSDAADTGGDVNLMTFHASKGLEYERVIMMECNDGTTPSGRALTAEAIEEERRLFYVAMTRAKRELLVLTTKKSGNKQTYPSRFISEIA